MVGMSTDKSADYLDPEAASAKAASDDCQVVAVYDTNNGAHLARAALVAAGIPMTAIHVIDRADPQPANAKSSPEARRAKLLQAIGSLFARAESPAEYHLAEDPNHALVVLTRGLGVDRVRARQILRASNPVEIYDCT
jgi:hypothetical protein